MKKKLLYLIAALAVAILSAGCEKFPDGQGELVVVIYNSDNSENVEVFPYTTEYVSGLDPIASAELVKGSNEIRFTLNAGNYSVYYSSGVGMRAVQVVAGESVTLKF